MRKGSVVTFLLFTLLIMVGCEGDMISSPDAGDDVRSVKGTTVTTFSISDESIEPTTIEGNFFDQAGLATACEARSALPGGIFGPGSDADNFWPDENGFDFSVDSDDIFLSWEAVGDNLMRTVFVYTNQTDPNSYNAYEYDGTITSDANLSAPDEEQIIHFAFCYNEPPPPPSGDEGCTPGYWRQEHHFDSWPDAYDPEATTFAAVFGRTITIDAKQGQGPPVAITNPLLSESVRANGGGVNALARAGTAALLNAASSDVAYAFTVAEVIAQVQDALDNGTEKDVAEALDEANNAVCPLD